MRVWGVFGLREKQVQLWLLGERNRNLILGQRTETPSESLQQSAQSHLCVHTTRFFIPRPLKAAQRVGRDSSGSSTAVNLQNCSHGVLAGHTVPFRVYRHDHCHIHRWAAATAAHADTIRARLAAGQCQERELTPAQLAQVKLLWPTSCCPAPRDTPWDGEGNRPLQLHAVSRQHKTHTLRVLVVSTLVSLQQVQPQCQFAQAADCRRA